MKAPAVIMLTLALAVPATWLATRKSAAPSAANQQLFARLRNPNPDQ